MTNDELIYDIALINTPGIGPVSFYKLIEKYGSSQEALSIQKNACSLSDAEKTIKQAKEKNITILSYSDKGYPSLLKELDDAPPVLYIAGRTDLLNYPANIAIVGARNASIPGRKIASKLAYDLTNADVLVISGLARGIDVSAHKGALYAKNQNGPTIAVVGTGVDVCYPSENKETYEQILTQGAIISEYPPETGAVIQNFPRRNRIISALSNGITIVEASLNSGSLITARLGLEQNKEIFAVPASPFENRSAGSNKLIKDGAVLTESAEDILNVLAFTQNRVLKAHLNKNLDAKKLDITKKTVIIREKKEQPTNNDLLSSIGRSGLEQDKLIRTLGKLSSEVMSELTELEFEGLITRKNGSFLSLTKEGLKKIS